MAERMNKVDNFWLCMDDPTNLMEITAFMEFEEPLDFYRLRETIEDRLTTFKRFKQRIERPASGVGVPNWAYDPHYDIRCQIQRMALPAPGDKAALKEVISGLIAMPLDQTKPLWHVQLIENYGKGCVVFFKIHHCIADGIALIHVLLSTTDTEPDAPMPERRAEAKKDPLALESIFPVKSMINNFKEAVNSGKQIGKRVIQGGAVALSDPARAKEVAKTVSGLAADAVFVLSRLTVMPPDPETAFKGKLGVHKSVAWTEPMSLGNIKTVGKAVEATINDVLIATVTGAMRRYLQKRDSRVNELDLRVAVPVNVRKPGKEFELGNCFSTVFLSLPVHIEDSVLRLREVKRRMDHLKKAPDAIVGFGVMKVLGILPPGLAQMAGHLFANKASAVMTNVPGPRQPLYFAGKKINNIMFWVPRTGSVGLGISILSYSGAVWVGLVSDTRLVPDPEAILEGFEDEFYYLLDLVKSGKIFGEPLVLHDRYEEAQAARKAREKEESSLSSNAGPEQCKAMTKSARQCRNRVPPGTEYCRVHQPKL